MFVSVIHRISDPEKFSEMVSANVEGIPSDLHLPQFFSSDDRRTMVCLWEAPSVQRVRDFLEPLTQGVCVNEYAAVDVNASRGLPAAQSV
jgi:hypothetical protein